MVESDEMLLWTVEIAHIRDYWMNLFLFNIMTLCLLPLWVKYIIHKQEWSIAFFSFRISFFEGKSWVLIIFIFLHLKMREQSCRWRKENDWPISKTIFLLVKWNQKQNINEDFLFCSVCVKKKNWFFTLNIRFFQADSLVMQEESSAIEQMEIQETKEESYNCSVELGGSLQCGIQEIHDSPSIVCFLGWCICGRIHAVVICFTSHRWNTPMKQRETNLNHQWLRLLSTKTCFWRIVDAVLTHTTRQKIRSSIL